MKLTSNQKDMDHKEHTKGKWTWYWTTEEKENHVHIVPDPAEYPAEYLNNGFIVAELYGPDAEANAQRICDLHNTANTSSDPFHDLVVPIKGGTFDMGDTFGDGFNQ